MKRKKDDQPLKPEPTPGDVAAAAVEENWVKGVPWNILCLVIVATWTFVIYSNTWHNELLFDDKVKILENPLIKSFEGLKQEKYRFITNLTYYLNYVWSGDPKTNPVPFHLFSIALHIVNSWLIFWLALLLIPPGSRRRLTAFLISLFFALHPFNTEAVNYLNSRQMLLVLLFMLSSFIMLVKAFPPTGVAPALWKRILFSVLGFFCVMGAVFSRESGVFVVLILVFYIFSFLIRSRKALVHATAITALSGIVATSIILYYRLLPLVSISPNNPFDELSKYWVTQSVVAMKYLSLALLPLPGRLNVDHEMSLIVDFDLLSMLSVAAVILCVPAIILLWKNHRLLSLFLFWICVCHGPTTFVVRSDYMVEYRNYTAMVGIAFSVVLLLDKLASRWTNGHRVLLGGFLLLGCLYSVAVWERNKAWKSEETLWADAIKKSPTKARVNVGVAMGYLKEVQERLPRQESVVRDQLKQKQIKETDFQVQMMEIAGRKRAAAEQGLALIEKATGLDERYYQGYPVGAAFCYQLGRIDDAIQWCSRVTGLIDREGRHHAYGQILGEAYNIRGVCHQVKGQPEQALSDFQKAVAYKSSFLPPYYSLIPLCIVMNRLDLARRYSGQCLQVLPGEPTMQTYAALLMYLEKPDDPERVRIAIRGLPKERKDQTLRELGNRVGDARVRTLIEQMIRM